MSFKSKWTEGFQWLQGRRGYSDGRDAWSNSWGFINRRWRADRRDGGALKTEEGIKGAMCGIYGDLLAQREYRTVRFVAAPLLWLD